MLITFYATLRERVGSKTLDVGYSEGITLRKLLLELMISFPGLRQEMTDENGNLPGHVLIFVNGRDQSFLADQLDTPLKMDDTIGIFPPIGGG